MPVSYFLGSSPPSAATQISLNDYGTGDGTTQDFALVNNTFAQLGNEAQAGTSSFFTKTGGTLTGSASNAHTSTAPSLGAGVVFEGATQGFFSAFDQAPYPQTDVKLFWVGDIANISTTKYFAPPGSSGMKLYFTNRIGSGGSDPSWMQFAPLNTDQSIGTYQAAGTPYYLPRNITGTSTIAAGTWASGITSITVLDGTQFAAGEWIYLEPGTANAEAVWIHSISTNILNLLAPTVYSHLAGGVVYECGQGVAVKCTVPNGAGGGAPKDFINTSLDVDYQPVAR